VADVRVINSGGKVGLHMLTPAADRWADRHLRHTETWQWIGDLVWMEPADAGLVMGDMQGAGLTMEEQVSD
jgi:hypothetical protein